MGFSISPERIIQLLFDVRREKKEKIANYLDAIATDAKLLADIWQEIWEKSQAKARNLDTENTIGEDLLRQNIKRFQDSDWQITPNG